MKKDRLVIVDEIKGIAILSVLLFHQSRFRYAVSEAMHSWLRRGYLLPSVLRASKHLDMSRLSI